MLKIGNVGQIVGLRTYQHMIVGCDLYLKLVNYKMCDMMR